MVQICLTLEAELACSLSCFILILTSWTFHLLMTSLWTVVALSTWEWITYVHSSRTIISWKLWCTVNSLYSKSARNRFLSTALCCLSSDDHNSASFGNNSYLHMKSQTRNPHTLIFISSDIDFTMFLYNHGEHTTPKFNWLAVQIITRRMVISYQPCRVRSVQQAPHWRSNIQVYNPNNLPPHLGLFGYCKFPRGISVDWFQCQHLLYILH